MVVDRVTTVEVNRAYMDMDRVHMIVEDRVHMIVEDRVHMIMEDRVHTIMEDRVCMNMEDRVHMDRVLMGIVDSGVPMGTLFISMFVIKTPTALVAKVVGPRPPIATLETRPTVVVVYVVPVLIVLQVGEDGSHIMRVVVKVALMARVLVPPLAMLLVMVVGRMLTAMEELVQVPMILTMKSQ